MLAEVPHYYLLLVPLFGLNIVEVDFSGDHLNAKLGLNFGFSFRFGTHQGNSRVLAPNLNSTSWKNSY